MVSLKIFVLENINQEDFTQIMENHDQDVGSIDLMNLTLKSSVDNFEILRDDMIFFVFQHDFKHETRLRGRLIEYPYSHKASFWLFFAEDKNYIFVEGEDKAINFLLEEIKKVIADDGPEEPSISREIIIRPCEIGHENFAKVLIQDGVEIHSAWFGKLDERVQSAFLSGSLKDEEGDESDFYKIFKDRAQEQTTVRYSSRKLGYTISISLRAHTISSQLSEATPESLAIYFKEEIHPILNMS